MGDREYAQQQQINDIIIKGADAVAKYTAARNKLLAAHPDADTSVIDNQIAKQKEVTDRTVAITLDGFKRMADGRADWRNGFNKALSDFMDQQQDVAGRMERITSELIGGFGDAFASFVSGTESAKKAFGSLVDSMYQEALKLVANQALA